MDLTRSYSTRSLQTPHGPSLLLAVACTVAMLAAAFFAGNSLPHGWWERDVSPPTAERITYVAPPVPVAPPTVRTAPSGAATRPAVPTNASPGGTTITAPSATAPIVSPVPSRGIAADTGVAGRGAQVPGGSGAAGAAGAVRGPVQSPSPLRVGAELPASPPLTRAQKDSVLQAFTRKVFGSPSIIAEALESAAQAKEHARDDAQRELGRTAGGGQPRAHGVQLTLYSIKFGGRSPEQQRRDSIVDADTRAHLAHAAQRARADSIRDAAARRADSLRIVPER